MIAKLIGRILCNESVRATLLDIARATPDEHIYRPNGDVYMFRYWLFNRITPAKDGAYGVTPPGTRKYPLIPFSIRIQRIMRPDSDQHLHDHSFNAWYWIMGGGYDEVRVKKPTLAEPNWSRELMVEYERLPGDFITVRHNEFHKITKLHGRESMSLFVLGRYKGPWGFLVGGEKMLRPEYERRYKPKAPTACKAVQHSDQTLCEPCGLGWDTNDAQRPMCKRRDIDRSKNDLGEPWTIRQE